MSDEELESQLRDLLAQTPQPPDDLVARSVAQLPSPGRTDRRFVWLAFAGAVGVIVLAALALRPSPTGPPTPGPIANQPSPSSAAPSPSETFDGIGGPTDNTPAPSVAWVRQFGSTRVEGIGAVATGDQRIYLAGWTQGSLPGHTNAGLEGNEDGFVVAYGLDGSLAWSDQFGSPSRDQVTDIAAVDDRVYVAGWSNGLAGQPFAGGGTDAFVRAYRSDGTVLWTKQFGTSGGDFGTLGVAADGGSVYVAGMTQGTFTGQTLSGPQDAFVARFATDGTLAWVRQFGTTAIDEAFDVAVGGGGVAIAGVTQGTFPGQTLAGAIDAFVRLIDTNGTERWTRQLGTADSEGWANVAYLGSDLYVGGSTFGTFAGLTRAGSWDAFAARLADGGASAWLVQYGSNQADISYASAADAASIVSVGGRGSVAFAQRITRDGAVSWRVDLTGPTSSQARGATFIADQIAVGGTVTGAFSGQTAAGGGDVFVALLDPASAPSIAVDATPITAPEGGVARATGTFSDANATDTVTLNATRGTVTRNGTTSGTWAWEAPIADGPLDGGPVTISATDQTGLSSTVRFDIVATNLPPTAIFEAPAAADEGSTFRIALTGPIDPSAADSAAGFSYSFDCGAGVGQFGSQAAIDCVAGTAGDHPVAGIVRDKDGATTTYAATIVIAAVGDRQPPLVGAPASAFAQGLALRKGKIPIQVSWTATDDGSGVARTELQLSTNGGAFQPVTLPTSTSLTVLRRVSPAQSYQFRARATDGAGNVSEWVSGPTFRLVVTQSESPLITYSAGWTSGPLTGAFGGTSTSSSTAGSTATFSFTGRAFAWVGSRGPAYGRAEIRIDGSLVSTINLARSTTQKRRILFGIAFQVAGAHTVEIRVLDAKVVHIDAEVVIQ